MVKEKVLHTGTKTFFHSMGIKVFFYSRIYNSKHNQDICPLCFKKIQNKDEVYLIINNYILFPNIFVHRACVGSKEECVRQLKSSYDKYKKFIKKYSFWAY